MNQFKWVFENMKGSKTKFFCGIFLHNLVVMPLIVAAPIFLSKFVDLVFQGESINFTKEAFRYLCFYLIVALIIPLFRYLYLMLLDISADDVLFNLRGKLYRKLSILSPSFYKKNRTGDIMMRLTGDLEAIRFFVVWVVTNAVYAVGIFVAGVIIFYSINWILATILFITAPIFSMIIARIRKKASILYKELREANSHLNETVQENIAGNRVVRAFVREEFEQEKFEKMNIAYRNAATESSMIWNRRGPFVELVSNIGLVLTVTIGCIMAIKGKITIGELLLFYNLNWLINESLRLLGMVLNEIHRFLSSTQKVYALYNEQSDIQNPPKTISPSTEKSGDVVFRNVSFKYEKYPVLKNVSLHAKPGQTIGIMGPTGAGKTTLCMLIPRFFDVHNGSVKIDGIDVRDYDLKELRRKIGISMQDVFLFSNTIDSNISYGNIDLSEGSVHSYAEMADANDFIEKTADGYATIVGEKGVGLSGGQKQRIALARALAYETPIVILDDTTSALDMETEKQIQARLAERKGRHTTFIVAQRISSVKDADMIYIVDKNTILECGTHKELLNNKGYYYDIYCLQQGDIGEGF